MLLASSVFVAVSTSCVRNWTRVWIQSTSQVCIHDLSHQFLKIRNCEVISWNTGQSLMEYSKSHSWMNMYDWLAFEVQSVQDGHHSQMTVENLKRALTQSMLQKCVTIDCMEEPKIQADTNFMVRTKNLSLLNNKRKRLTWQHITNNKITTTRTRLEAWKEQWSNEAMKKRPG